jgi:hypothetical protein
MGRACNTHRNEEGWIQRFEGKARRKETTRKPKTWWVDNIKMDFIERYDGVIWTGLIWLRIGTSGGLL